MQNKHDPVFHRMLGSTAVASVALAVLVGVGAGVGAVLFRWMIATTGSAMFGASETWLGGLGRYHVIPVPAVGGLVVGLIVYFLAREAKGSGIPEVMLSVAQQGGKIRARVALLKPLASAICIGSGGSAGREGPIVQIASSLGSILGQVLRMPDKGVRLLVACGAAGGVAATFNAPIGGALFASEVILRDFGVGSFVSVVLSSVAATALSHATLGDTPAFIVPRHQSAAWFELPLYVLLGVASGLVAIAFTWVLHSTADVFDRMRVPEYVKPAIGGLLVGCLGAFLPQVFGVGYDTIEAALHTKLEYWLCGLLVLVKLLGTSITIGSGGSGGVFAPALYIGAALGSLVGQAFNGIIPGFATSPEGYAIAGMGAVFAGAARAPVSTVLILFEMTADYRVIVPLMAAVVVSTLVAERLMHADIYTLKLIRRGIDIKTSPPSDPMTRVTVDQVMTRQVDTVQSKMPLEELVMEFQETGHHGFPVLDDEGMLFGIVTLSDLERAAVRGLHDRLVEDIAVRNVMVCHPGQTLREALAEPAAGEVGRLPVVDPDDPRKLLGILRRSDIIHAYSTGAAGLPPDEHPIPPEDEP